MFNRIVECFYTNFLPVIEMEIAQKSFSNNVIQPKLTNNKDIKNKANLLC
jgi:hypothetical protein